MTLEFKRILVPLDFSASSARALDYAYAMAMKFDASLHLVHVCEVPSMLTASMDAYAIAYTDWSQRLGEEAERELEKLRPRLAGVKVSTEVLFGNPARAIITAAATNDADLIVMGTHGHGPVMHVVMGNVAERVVRTAECPVLTVREPREKDAKKKPAAAVSTAAALLVAGLLMSPFGVSAASAQDNPPPAQQMKQTRPRQRIVPDLLRLAVTAPRPGATVRWRRPCRAGRRISPRSPSGTAANFRQRWCSAPSTASGPSADMAAPTCRSGAMRSRARVTAAMPPRSNG